LADANAGSTVFEPALHGRALFVEGAELPQACVARQALAVLVDEVGQVDAADLLLSLDDEFDAARQLAALREQRVDREQARHQVSLVVAHPAAEQLAVPARGLERRRGPQLERLRWLDVVVVVDQQRPVRASGTLSQHHRRPSAGSELGLEAAAPEHRRHQLRARLHAEILRGDAGLGDQCAQLGQALLEVLLDVSIHGGEVGHVELRVRSAALTVPLRGPSAR